MAKSMTSYGKYLLENEICDVKVEIRTLNSKYCDINVRIPKQYLFLDVKIRNLVKERLVRGKIDVFVEINPKETVNVPVLNKNLLSAYMSILREIQKESEIIDDIRIDHILRFQDVIKHEDNDELYDEVGNLILEALDKCLNDVIEMRKVEGERLKDDILRRVELLGKFISEIETFQNKNFELALNRLKDRIKELKLEVDEDRLMQEVALMAERSDINEEVVRVKSHLEQIKNIFSEDEIGKKLDFLAQELHREFNTIGSKAVLSDIKNIVIKAKVEIDKIREQVQNLV